MIKSEVVTTYDGETVTVNHFTVEEVFDALAKDGFEHLRGQWVSFKGGLVVGGCALGQAAVNLKAIPEESEGETEAYPDPYTKTNMSVVAQLNRFHVRKDSKWAAYGGPRLGDVIVAWNDRIVDGSGGTEYFLKTYAEVIDMARSVMKRHFGRVVYLINQDYPVDLATLISTREQK